MTGLSIQVHHELELGVIIGQVCTRAAADNWRDYVAGYVLALDMTARDLQTSAKQKGAHADTYARGSLASIVRPDCPFAGLPWSTAKGMDTFTPLSAVVPADTIEDPHNLTMELLVNGERRMHADTANMVHRIPQLIESISSKFTLEPGDLSAFSCALYPQMVECSMRQSLSLAGGRPPDTQF